ncbi:MAG TPA: amino acid ABC transporter substrate-binding protein [Bauldia sp.]|nr:amino acid ABC transporter substrate-binding protein [Bauldia sp.]
MARHFRSVAGAFVALGLLSASAAGATLDTLKERGRLLCGVNTGLNGFSAPGPDGAWSGFDVDFCKAVAAAVFDDAGKVEYVPLSAADRFEALKTGKIDLLSRNSTWTMGRETGLGLTFVGITYYDGQGFLMPRAANVMSALELDGSKVCVQSGTTTEANLADYFTANNMALETVLTGSPAESIAAYEEGRCNVITSDMSQLYAERLKLAAPDEHIILPDAISKEPLGPAVRADDPQWALIVKWVYFALLNAEELGVASDTIDAALASDKPEVRRLVGTDGAFGEEMGLTRDWAARIIRAVGNYGEIYERNLGVDSTLGIPRGMNQLWNRGGIQYAPPIR